LASETDDAESRTACRTSVARAVGLMMPGWASPADHRTRAATGQPAEAPVDPRGSAATQTSEGLADGIDVAAAAHRLADVSRPAAPSWRPAAAVRLDRHAGSASLEHARVALVAVRAHASASQLVARTAAKVAEEVEVTWSCSSWLDAGDDLDAEALAGGERPAVGVSWSVIATARSLTGSEFDEQSA
jgi:hypothetical protein